MEEREREREIEKEAQICLRCAIDVICDTNVILYMES